MLKFLDIKGDRVIWGVVILLSIASLVAVYSSTGMLAFQEKGGNTEYYLIKHFFILLIGLGLIYATHKIKYHKFSRISIIAYIISIPLLIILMVAGKNHNEAVRSLEIPIIHLSFQPFDVAKLSLILFIAHLLTNAETYFQSVQKAFYPILIIVSIICGLIFPSNFSTSALLFLICLIMMYIGGINWKKIALILGIGLGLVALIYLMGDSLPDWGRLKTIQSRIESHIHPDKANNKDELFQAEQSRIAIATGGVFGKMPGNGTQKNILPYPYSDFIYAIIIEEFGLVGGGFLLLMYLILIYRGVRIATKCPYNFGAIAAFGISLALVIQAIVNMGVTVSIFPVTGQNLPLVSMGGTSVWFTCISIGIMLSISKEIEPPIESTLENSEEIEPNDTEYATA
ncbi:MAG: FtsW/RodA/SpoVE family cell cycle protein [Lentimicrobiaceae bacterium]|nr:FtsW/RodA/SpoVE family cell cycle protein [Lentimicrobiaceae bacterium]